MVDGNGHELLLGAEDVDTSMDALRSLRQRWSSRLSRSGGSPGSSDGLAARRRFAARLSGIGVEIGPGHAPFPVPAGVVVRYVDRWAPEENRALFPELGEEARFSRPDTASNLDRHRLTPLADQSQDFVIAGHILDHLADEYRRDVHEVADDHVVEASVAQVPSTEMIANQRS